MDGRCPGGNSVGRAADLIKSPILKREAVPNRHPVLFRYWVVSLSTPYPIFLSNHIVSVSGTETVPRIGTIAVPRIESGPGPGTESGGDGACFEETGVSVLRRLCFF